MVKIPELYNAEPLPPLSSNQANKIDQLFKKKGMRMVLSNLATSPSTPWNPGFHQKGEREVIQVGVAIQRYNDGLVGFNLNNQRSKRRNPFEFSIWQKLQLEIARFLAQEIAAENDPPLGKDLQLVSFRKLMRNAFPSGQETQQFRFFGARFSNLTGQNFQLPDFLSLAYNQNHELRLIANLVSPTNINNTNARLIDLKHSFSEETSRVMIARGIQRVMEIPGELEPLLPQATDLYTRVYTTPKYESEHYRAFQGGRRTNTRVLDFGNIQTLASTSIFIRIVEEGRERVSWRNFATVQPQAAGAGARALTI